jgi:putative selenate reductase
VIGGGDVAMDCARAAKRNKGVETVSIVYRLTVAEMPAQREERELARADGVEFVELCAPVSFKDGLFTGEKMKLTGYDAGGRRGITGTGEMRTFHFDTVINATGARVDTALFDKNGIKLTERGLPVVNADNESSIAGVYIAGDCRTGPATVVRALADGKTIARAILKKLALTDDFITVTPEARETAAQNPAALYDRRSAGDGRLLGYVDAKRCLSCGELCEICADVCPNRANVAVKIDGHVKIDGFANPHQIVHIDRMCNECGNCAVFCPQGGRPYKDKFTVFSTAEDAADSENAGFIVNTIGGSNALVRTDNDAKKQAQALIDVINAQYHYLLTEA